MQEYTPPEYEITSFKPSRETKPKFRRVQKFFSQEKVQGLNVGASNTLTWKIRFAEFERHLIKDVQVNLPIRASFFTCKHNTAKQLYLREGRVSNEHCVHVAIGP